MDFEITEEQEMMRQSIRNVLKKNFSSAYLRKLDEDAQWPHEVIQKIGEMGFLGLPIPIEYGGSGGSSLDVTLVQEELSRGLGGTALFYILLACFGGKTLPRFGNERQKRELLPGLASNKLIFSLALTEPSGGTDILAMKSRAEIDEKGTYLINGQKLWISGAHVANWLITVVRTKINPNKKADGFTIFLVDPKSPGVEIRPINIFFNRTSGANEIFFTDVQVPKENIIGDVDHGFYHLLEVLNDERILTAAHCVGIGYAAFENALQYAKEREAFGRPIGQFQAIQHKLADCYMRLEAARYMVYRAAWLQTKNVRCGLEATMCKVIASEATMWCVDQGVRILGGYAASFEYDMNRYFRDARVGLGPVTNEMAKNYIATELGLPRSY